MKILLISYYSLPLNGVSSYRVDSFCNHFSSEGANVTLLTRHWNENYSNWNDLLTENISDIRISTNNNFRVIRLPYYSKNNGQSNKIKTVKNYLSGRLHSEIRAYENFKKYALELLLKENDFDIIVTSAPPYNLVRLAYYLNKKTQVPFIIDFRDFFNLQYLRTVSNINLNEKVLHSLSLFYLNKWLRKCNKIITVSPKLVSIFEEKFGVKTVLITNGLDAQYFENRESIYTPNKTFTVRFIGTAHNHQNFNTIIKGLKVFQKKHPEKPFKIELVGLRTEKIENLFSSEFDDKTLQIYSKRIPKKESTDKLINTDVLMLPWNNFSGVYGTKVFDYLASGSHILLCPSDNNVVEKLVKSNENSSVCSNSEEVYKTISNQYDKWMKGTNKVFSDKFKSYSREKQAQNFYSEIWKSIHEEKN